jgi:hypothetical protein
MSLHKREQNVAGRRRNGAYGMSSTDPVGDNGKASADGKDGQARTPMVQTGIWAWTAVAGTGMWAHTFRAGTGMWARTLRRVLSGGCGRDCKEDCELEVRF